jgi:hypothetical protein
MVSLPAPCRGFAARLRKTLRVSGARLTVDYRLENVGSQPISTTEYNHNFMAIDGQRVDKQYRLRLDSPLPAGMQPPLQEQAGVVTWSPPPEKAYSQRFDGDGRVWELIHTGRAAGVRERVTPGRVWLNLWGTPRLVCPEAFVRIEVAPGCEQTWQREYEFFET